MAVDYLGWAATAVFVGSYFCPRAETLRRVQMFGALRWAAYGVLIEASPVVAANLLVFGAAAWTAVVGRQCKAGGHSRSAPSDTA